VTSHEDFESARARERAAAIATASALVILRAFVFVWWEQSHFDADQAIVGLMAKHLIETRAFPLFFYGQQYLLGVESWLVAPFFLVGGISVATLKLPLLLLNLLTAVLLIVALERFVGLRPWVAALVSLFFILPPPSAASRLVQANGCNIEPFVYVLLVWWLRARPLWLGVVLGVGALNREFTLYGLTALVVVELLQGRLWSRDRLRGLALAGLLALGIWQGVQALVPYASARGPGTSYAEVGVADHTTEVQRRFCWPDDLPQRLTALATFQLPELFGAAQQPVGRVGIIGSTLQGVDGLWPVLLVVFALAAGRTAWLVWSKPSSRVGADSRHLDAPTAGAQPRDGRAGTPSLAPATHEKPEGRIRAAMAGPLAFGAFLALVGAQSALVYGVTCGQRSHLTMRYMLLALLAPVGIGACYLAVEQSRRLAGVFAMVVGIWAAVSAAAHLALLEEYVTDPPPADYRLLTDYLEQERVRYARAPFWDAYAVTFLSGERVRVGSSDLVRVEEYVRQYERHRRTAVSISSSPCQGPRVARWWVCPAGGS
jgi:hypothetical protein